MKIILILFLIYFIKVGFSQEQIETKYGFFNDSIKVESGCPKLYTRGQVKIPAITIKRIEIKDSVLYTELPKVLEDLETIQSRIEYPLLALAAEIKGPAVIEVHINSKGEVSNLKVIKGIFEQIEESAIQVLKEVKYRAAIRNEKNAESSILFYIDFDFIQFWDAPNEIIDEIQMEASFGGQIYNKRKIIIKKDNTIEMIYDNGNEKDEYAGSIYSSDYKRLSDFIISQCYENYNDQYEFRRGYISHNSKTIIEIRKGEARKKIEIEGNSNIPLGLWAIIKLIEGYGQLLNKN